MAARVVSVEAVKKYLEEEIFPNLEGRRFAAVYVHTEVNRGDNFPGISALRWLYDAVPAGVWENLETLYFLHPGIQSRLFLATFGRLMFGGLYGKLKYVTRLEFLWDHIRRKGAEMPEFVCDFDDEMDCRPATLVDYGLESDHPGILPSFDSTVATYSMRCIA
ncbi:SEC14 cytosolic factor family protein / phosphoglyceride transfer family protein [Perilla frutescens var. hirtella]|uniref:SEC14 cytosolic factor family protein / phosphoglyceride transfer family protein n=1 Tax=Perilla frutescens var. hirtella TaxID=608512 RepID=A0AAD4IU45_PERFH|nr:SEC14 cytosolic factor family protein / phosphoglyceride transfer family protein [Perilla frutescens var. hirtella]